MSETANATAALVRALAKAEVARRQQDATTARIVVYHTPEERDAALRAHQGEARRLYLMPSNGRGPGERVAALAELARQGILLTPLPVLPVASASPAEMHPRCDPPEPASTPEPPPRRRVDSTSYWTPP